MGLRDLIDLWCLDPRLLCKLAPPFNCSADGFNQQIRAASLDASSNRKTEQVITKEVITFPGETHLVFASPLTTWIPHRGNIESGGELPASLLIHQEGDVLHAIVLVARQHVEDGATHLFFNGILAQSEPANHCDGLFVTPGAGLIEIVVCHRAQGKHVQFASFGGAIKSSGHEVRAPTLFVQKAVRHVNACGLCHQGIGILDAAEPGGVSEFAITIVADTIELEEPVLKSLARWQLTRARRTRLRTPGQDRLRPVATCRSTDTQDVFHHFAIIFAMQFALQSLTSVQNSL